MNGWAILLLLAALLAGGLILVARPPRSALMLIAAAISVAFAGYAWQGHAGLAGKPTRPQDTRQPPDDLFSTERRAILETVGNDPQLLDAADRLIASGDADYAIGTIRAGLVQRPRSMVLWLGLGNALIAFADGHITPPARFAFDRAAALAPGNPAPPYFLGLAYAASGDLPTADTIWTDLVSRPIADPAMRVRVLARLALLRQIAAQARRP